VPALAAGSAPLVEPLLAACEGLIARLLAQAPQTVVCVGVGERTTRRRARDWGTLAGFGGYPGAELGVGLGAILEAPSRHDHGLPHLSQSLTVGRWLLERVGWTGAVVMQEVGPGSSAADCGALGRQLADETGPRSVWLALGDGSICRGLNSPGHDDPRSAGFDAQVATAFAAADLDALLGLDVGLAAEVGAAGRPAWQVLAGAARDLTAPIDAQVHYDAAPFGVGYLVAGWFGS
jgi:hypothetical protein